MQGEIGMLAVTTRIEPGGHSIPAAQAPDITRPITLAHDGKGPAILFADVSRSMLLHERLGDTEAREVIDVLLNAAEKAVKAHRGRVVKAIGDEILAVLPTADAAAQAGRDLLIEVESLGERGGIKLGMHIGLHAGAFIERKGDVFGDAVNVASRLTAHAQSGQILTTSASVGGLSPLVRGTMRKLGPLDIRGRREQIQVEEILWRGSLDEEATFTEGTAVAAHCGTRLVLRLEGREWTVGPHAKSLAIGRTPCADIEVATTEASRNHGLVEYRNGGFFYTDMSLNGSFVSFGQTGETLVQRSQVLLSGQGVICFGHSAKDPGEPLAFHVEPVEQ